jgi:hypothetical protein
MKEEFFCNPWEHILTENCLDPVIFLKLKTELSLLFNNISTGNYTFELYDLYLKGFSTDLIDYLIEYTEETILNNYSYMLDKFSFHRKSKNGYICIPEIGVSRENRYGIHDDTHSNFKAMTFLIYISPENSIGTELYRTSENFLDPHTIATWKPNSGIYFCPKDGVTFHDFFSNNEIRITLNLNLSSVDFLLNLDIRRKFFHNLEKDRMIWLLEYFKKGKMHRTTLDLVKIVSDELDKK